MDIKVNNNNVTTIDELKAFAAGEAVQLPPFVSDIPFVARLKKPSLMVMIKTGKIPNKLMKTAVELFEGDNKDDDKETDEMKFERVKDMFEIMQVVAESALVEPSAATLKEVGLELTDDQLLAIFDYVQDGVKTLDSFREESKSDTDFEHGKDVAEATE